MAVEMTDCQPLKTAIRLIVHCVAPCLPPYSMFWTVWDRECHSALFNFLFLVTGYVPIARRPLLGDEERNNIILVSLNFFQLKGEQIIWNSYCTLSPFL